MRREQQHLLIFIADYINDNNQAPTLREMAKARGYSKATSIAYMVAILTRDGYLSNKGRKRGINIIKVPQCKHPVIQATLDKALAWEWRRDPAPKAYVKKGYRKTNPKLSEYHAKRREARRD